MRSRKPDYGPYWFWQAVLQKIDRRKNELGAAEDALLYLDGTTRRLRKAVKAIQAEYNRMARLRFWVLDRVSKCEVPR